MQDEWSENDDESMISEDKTDKDFDINEYRSVESEATENENDEEPEEPSKNIADEEEEETLLPGEHRFNKKFVCIRYPGNVVNPEKAMETMGGIGNISTAVTTSNRRLELRFRPTDGYCKPACGDRHTVSAFLLRIRTKKSRVEKINEAAQKRASQNFRNLESAMPVNPMKSNTEGNLRDITEGLEKYSLEGKENSEEPDDVNSENVEEKNSTNASPFGKSLQKNSLPTFDKFKYEDLSKDENYHVPKVKVLGRVETEFRFTNLCDFQYLPVTKSTKDHTKNESIYESIYPTGIPPYKWLETKVPYFLPPAVFSRMDSVQQHSLKTESKETGPENAIGKTRKRRAGFSNFIHFTSETIPTEPPKGIETAMKVKFLNHNHLQVIRAHFEERPIWSKTALMCRTNFTSEQLRILLPSCAYYFMTGPWRVMWVKLGYDPRKDPSARKYQTLDYRLKSMHGLEQNIKGKRSYTNYILPYKSAPNAKPKTAILRNMGEEQEVTKEKRLSDDVYIYREGMMPPSRQMFYQYCDILSEEIEEMLRKLPDPLPGTKCHEKRGWLPSGFSDQCREIINRQVKAVLRKKMNIPEDHPTTLPRKRKVSRTLKLPQVKSEKRRKLMERKSPKSFQKKGTKSPDHNSDEEWEDV